MKSKNHIGNMVCHEQTSSAGVYNGKIHNNFKYQTFTFKAKTPRAETQIARITNMIIRIHVFDGVTMAW